MWIIRDVLIEMSDKTDIMQKGLDITAKYLSELISSNAKQLDFDAIDQAITSFFSMCNLIPGKYAFIFKAVVVS